jgi:hypothetical protein
MSDPNGIEFDGYVGRTTVRAYYWVKDGILFVKYSGKERSAPRDSRGELLQAQSILHDLMRIGPGSVRP